MTYRIYCAFLAKFIKYLKDIKSHKYYLTLTNSSYSLIIEVSPYCTISFTVQEIQLENIECITLGLPLDFIEMLNTLLVRDSLADIVFTEDSISYGDFTYTPQLIGLKLIGQQSNETYNSISLTSLKQFISFYKLSPLNQIDVLFSNGNTLLGWNRELTISIIDDIDFYLPELYIDKPNVIVSLLDVLDANEDIFVYDYGQEHIYLFRSTFKVNRQLLDYELRMSFTLPEEILIHTRHLANVLVESRNKLINSEKYVTVEENPQLGRLVNSKLKEASKKKDVDKIDFNKVIRFTVDEFNRIFKVKSKLVAIAQLEHFLLLVYTDVAVLTTVPKKSK